MKKVALIGNMNNNFFALARHLRDRGFDAHVFFRPAAEHFHPKADTFDLSDLNYCHEVDWFSIPDIVSANDQVLRDLDGFDFLIGCGDEAAMVSRAGATLDIYVPYGSDIYKYAHLPHDYTWHVKLRSILGLPGLPRYKNLKYGTLSRYIYQAIKHARYIWWDYANEEVDSHLYKINPHGTILRYPVPFIYPKSYERLSNKTTNRDVHWGSIIETIRIENEFLLLYHGRQEWANTETYRNNHFSNKNTHHLILGFSEFIKSNPKSDARLIMIEYGGGVQMSKQLVRELELKERVIWFPLMYRKDIINLINNVDVCCGEFAKSYITFGTIVEAMLMGKPILHYRDDELYKDKYQSLYPLYNCREPSEIAACLEDALHDKERRIEIGKAAQEWVNRYIIEKPLSVMTSIISGTYVKPCRANSTVGLRGEKFYVNRHERTNKTCE